MDQLKLLHDPLPSLAKEVEATTMAQLLQKNRGPDDMQLLPFYSRLDPPDSSVRGLNSDSDVQKVPNNSSIQNIHTTYKINNSHHEQMTPQHLEAILRMQHQQLRQGNARLPEFSPSDDITINLTTPLLHSNADALSTVPGHGGQIVGPLPTHHQYERESGHCLRRGYLHTVFTQITEMADSPFGTILHAVNRYSRQSCAIKVIPSHRPHFRFQQHSELAHKLTDLDLQPDIRRQHVVRVLDCWTEEVEEQDPEAENENKEEFPFKIFSDPPIASYCFVAMEFCPEGTLTNLLHKRRPFRDDALIFRRLRIDILQGLQLLHDVGVVHGNLNPDNILLCRDIRGNLRAKIGGFVFGPDFRALESCSEGYCTKYYVSPECSRSSGAAVFGSDVYSLAAIFFATKIVMVREDGSTNNEYFKIMEQFTAQKYPEGDSEKSLYIDMTDKDPEKRPTANEVLRRLLEAETWKGESVPTSKKTKLGKGSKK